MATASVSPDLPKPSFAKVAASVSKDTAPRRIATPSKEQPMSSTKPPAPTAPVIANGRSGKAPAGKTPSPQPEIATSSAQQRSGVDNITASLKDLKLREKAPSLVVNGSGPLAPERPTIVTGRDSGSDDSQRADSSSELGTKPPSLDGKSITSGTTFALDEKESLRPDDSASVKAAEDDDAFSIRGSLVAGSRMGSEVAARARGIPLGDIPERRLPQPAPGVVVQGVLTPQSSSSEQPPGAPLGVGGSSDALNVIYRQAPDEKLLEAMASPKDRLFLLRLEKQVIDFVQDSKEPYMDLPPSNSFCRMLTHKLADYYHMTHSFEPHVGSVRIFRTPFCRVPTSLALINPNPNTSSSSTPPPAVLPRKIMRRGQDSEGGPSASPSKPTSETGSDAKDKPALANQKLTREEREELYKLARERIFGSSEENVADNDGDNGVSRTSSVSAKDKSNLGKRGKTGKQRRDDSDSFDSRNQYTPYWGPQQQTWVPQPQYMTPPNPQYAAQPPPPAYQGQMGPVYAQQSPGYPAMPGMVTNQPYPQYAMPPYAPQTSQPRYPSGGSPMATYGAPVPPTGPQQPNWQPGFAPSPQYQPRAPAPSGPQGHMGIPYAYGQLPANANPNDPKSQHPIPGSYNRNHAFNPKTQSFVPGVAPVQPPQPPFTAPGSHHGSPQVGSPHLSYPGAYQQPMPQPYGGGYGMVRQGSSSSMPAYHSPHVAHVQHVPPPMSQNPQHMAPQPLPHNPPAHIPNRPNIPQGPSQQFSLLPTYGNPATLPQKPATGM
ncbi:R3H domain-containing [Fusarium albosuccineum]|uniref:R3H domain-containing n=1 Tax=Fusarium albosuccineum TaxID=1237068 RepID=A0A8H4PAN4_9HYPO|nr:R3H domain-containing [Fusarium albosuccineum]